jgi:hypothetical protein
MTPTPSRGLVPSEARPDASHKAQDIRASMHSRESLSPWQFVYLRKEFVLIGSQLHRSDPADGDVVFFVVHQGVFRQVNSASELILTLVRLSKGAPW